MFFGDYCFFFVGFWVVSSSASENDLSQIESNTNDLSEQNFDDSEANKNDFDAEISSILAQASDFVESSASVSDACIAESAAQKVIFAQTQQNKNYTHTLDEQYESHNYHLNTNQIHIKHNVDWLPHQDDGMRVDSSHTVEHKDNETVPIPTTEEFVSQIDASVPIEQDKV